MGVEPRTWQPGPEAEDASAPAAGAALPSARVHFDADRDAWLVHRPARSWPRPPETGPVRIPAPPDMPRPDTGSALGSALPLLSSLGIVAFAFVAGSVVYLVVAGVLIVAILGGTVGTRLAARRRERRGRARVREDYLRRLARAEARARTSALVQRDALLGLYPDTAGHLDAVRFHGALWERRPGDPDFASVRLGLGTVPAAAPVRLADGEVPLGALPEPDLAARAETLSRDTATLADAPVVVPLRTLSAVAVVGEPARGRALVGAWVASLAATCAPTDLRVMGLASDTALPAWEWCKWLPHTRDTLGGDGFGRSRRAVTGELAAFAAAVHSLVGARTEQARLAREATGGSDADTRSPVHAEHVLVVVDGYDPESLSSLSADLEVLLVNGARLAVTVVLIAADPRAAPSSLGARVDLLPGDRVRYREAGPDGRIEDDVAADVVDPEVAEQLARAMAPLQLADVDANADLVDTVRLVELLGYDNAEQLDPVADWLTPAGLTGTPTGPPADPHPAFPPAEEPPLGPVPSDLLSTPIGVRSDGSRVVLDLKEAASGGMGPHGVLVGATGSGKSELLRSLVGGLAARHDPSLLNVLLVDFKGGAAFAELGGLPHTTGLITNLADDLSLVDRMRVSLAGELDRRQQLLRDAGDVESIGRYQQLRAERRHLPALPYLLVVVDEFGELLSARPEFIETFVAIGRLGRSLGVHLLLATQRLDEGRIRGLESHLRYRICLRTYAAAESTAVIGVPDAHGLPALPGLGYLRVDADLVRFKAATASLPHQPLQPHAKAPAVVLPFGLATAGSSPAAPDDADPVGYGAPDRRSRPTELTALVGRLRAATSRRPTPVWLPPLPDQVPLPGLLAEVPASKAVSQVPVGLLDDPARQAQVPLVLDLTGSGGHAACVGSPRTGKTTFLRTLVQALSSGRGAGDASVYVLDLGGGGLHDLASAPHVGAVVGRHDPDAVARLVREMTAMVNERAAAFRACGVTSLAGLRRHDDGPSLLPDPLACEVFLLIDNIAVLRNEFPELDLALADLAATSLQFGVHVVVTANRWLDVRPALLDAIGTRVELHLNDPVDSLAGRARAQSVPADRPGRGILRDGRHVQLALPSDVGAGPEDGLRAPRVLPLPARVTVDDVPALAAEAGRPVTASQGLLLGVAEFRLTPEVVDLAAPGSHLVVYGDEGSGRTTLLRRIFDHLTADATPGELQLHVVDLSRALLDQVDSKLVAHYAFARSQVDALVADLLGELLHRLPPPDLDRQALLERSWWSGPEHVLLIDDYELTLAGAQSPLSPMADAVAHARDIGLHVVLNRAVAGASRSAFEPFGQRLRELTPHALILDGERSEGPLIGDRTARRRPPGRGLLVRRGAPDTLVQLALPGREQR